MIPAMSTSPTFWFIIAFVVFDVLVVMPLIIRGLVTSAWSPIAERHPLSDALRPDMNNPKIVRREFRSISVGMVNLGGCMHLTATDDHLIFEPALVARVLGVKPAAVPWTQIRHLSSRGNRAVIVAAGREITGPADLFEPARDTTEPRRG
jgi:hypothetical protein